MIKGWHIYSLVHYTYNNRWHIGIGHYTGERDPHGGCETDAGLVGEFSPEELIAILRPYLQKTPGNHRPCRCHPDYYHTPPPAPSD